MNMNTLIPFRGKYVRLWVSGAELDGKLVLNADDEVVILEPITEIDRAIGTQTMVETFMIDAIRLLPDPYSMPSEERTRLLREIVGPRPGWSE